MMQSRHVRQQDNDLICFLLSIVCFLGLQQIAEMDDILNDLNDLDSGQQISEVDSEAEEDSQGIAFAPTSRNELLASPQFKQHLETIRILVDSKINGTQHPILTPEETLISRSNYYSNLITREIAVQFRQAKVGYGRKFPQLQSIVTQPALYCKSLLEIEKGGSAFQYLSNHQKMSLQIALSSLHQVLPAADAEAVLEKAGTVVELNEHNNLLLIYLESCMQSIAPNLCQLLGCFFASKLISLAGGVKELAAIPACNIQVMGGQRSSQIGLNVGQRNHTGLFNQLDMVRDAPQRYKMQLVRMFASNTAKCARADSLGSSAGLGARLREELYERYDKIQEEGGLYRVDQPLPVPDLQPKKKRGGKRHRKNKELQELSQLRKQQNRLKFGQQAEEQIAEGVGLGMLSQGGKLRVGIKKQKLKLSKKTQQRAQKKSGLQSSLNLNASQGMQLFNPLQAQQDSGKQTIFSKSSGFQTVLNNKFGSYK